ncbi:MAG: fused MFS/spermidine synthase [Acidobacteria bacterium]|nr:fused MFS/spermidine synthase [Acidobacteriota bacterium]
MSLFWYFVFFLVSGFCSLVYEVVWLRLAMAKFGVTTPMVSIVLSVFMAGLALGSWAGGVLVRRSERTGGAHPLRLYGLVELLIGASGLLVPYLLQFGYERMTGSGDQLAWDSSFYYLYSSACVVVSLLPWCTAMGATFPLAMAAIRRTTATAAQRSFSYLYLSNVLGAVLGTLIPAFVLIELWGFQATLRLAALLNGLLALTVFALSYTRASSPIPEKASTPAETKPALNLYGLPERSTLILLFITGLLTMAMEVVWIRQFTVFLGNVVYSFAVILSAYLLATWIGSVVYRRWARTHEPHESAGIWVFLGVLAMLPFAFTDPELPVSEAFPWAIFRTVAGIGPISAALGFLTPLLVDQFSRDDPGRAGRAYAVNIVGGILGPLLSGFWILPWLGDRWGLITLSIPLFGIGFIAAFRNAPQTAASTVPLGGSRYPYIATLLVAVAIIATTKDSTTSLTDRVELRDYMATVVAGKQYGSKRLLINGIGMTTLTTITKHMAHLPLALLDRPPRNGLVLCFGMGTSFRSMLSWGIDSTVVELVPSVPQLFNYFHADGPELVQSPAAHIVIDDGRRYLERTNAQFDVITMDPPPPVTTPTTSLLYSREFYGVMKKRLRPGGIFQAWLALRDPGWDLSTQTAFVKALQDSFPYIRVFPSLGGVGFHMLASDQPIRAQTAQELASRMPARAAADLVEWGSGRSTEEMFELILKTEQQITRLAAIRPAVPPIQDDLPINEYFFLRRLFGPYP